MKRLITVFLIAAAYAVCMSGCSATRKTFDSATESNVSQAEKENKQVATVPLTYMNLDGYKVWYGEYEVNGVIAFDERMPERLIEQAKAQAEAARRFKDGTRVTLNNDNTYEIRESGKVVSSGTYEIGIYFAWTCEMEAWYYPGPRSFMGYLGFTDSNGQKMQGQMQIAADKTLGKERGILWMYHGGFHIKESENSMPHEFGIRYGFTYCE